MHYDGENIELFECSLMDRAAVSAVASSVVSDAQGALPPAIFLMGPTASGKTALAMALCDRLPCDIISVDSALIYKGMDIGTAKPTKSELAAYPHRLVDIVDPSESYSAAQFRKDALSHMAEISASGRIPLLVGGTMLYFKSLLEGLADMPESDPAIRAAVSIEAEQKGWPAMHQLLSEVDPALAETIHPQHSQRIGRALEVYRQTGKTMTEWRAAQRSEPFPYSVVKLAIAPSERQVLHKRIERRLDQMFADDFESEVRALRARGDLHLDLPSIRAVGYRQVWEYLDEIDAAGESNYQSMREKCAAATRQLAKRQFTWLRSWQGVENLTYDSGILPTDKALEVIFHAHPQISAL